MSGPAGLSCRDKSCCCFAPPLSGIHNTEKKAPATYTPLWLTRAWHMAFWHSSVNELRKRMSLRSPAIWGLPFYSAVLAIFLLKKQNQPVCAYMCIHVHKPAGGGSLLFPISFSSPLHLPASVCLHGCPSCFVPVSEGLGRSFLLSPTSPLPAPSLSELA